MDIVSSIAMFGYTAVFGIIGLVLYCMITTQNKRRKQYGIYCNSILVYEIRIDRTTYRCVSTWVNSSNNNSKFVYMFDVLE